MTRSGVRVNGFTPAGVARMLGRDHGERVYAITDGQAVKIGRTGGKHPHERLAELQVGNPRELVLLAWTRGSERAWHRALWADHVRGEWFRLTPRLLDAIRAFDWLDEQAVALATF